ncbi:uncharacterized protein [Palaemon carinicauda]|uniref:uncharacterized protein n=1 Tax=Palaemon carinicauda TaxID=392227 RepID=UPI0035B5AB6B
MGNNSVQNVNNVGYVETNVKENRMGLPEESTKSKGTELYDPFMGEGWLHLPCVEKKKVKWLRDTGAVQSVMVRNMYDQWKDTGEYVLLRGFGPEFSAPIVEVKLETPLISGFVKIALVREIPVSGVELILGNDLCGDKVFGSSNPILTEKPSNSSSITEVECTFPNIFPACAVTTRNENLKVIRDNALVDIKDIEKEGKCYFVKDGIPMRKFKSRNVNDVVEQVIIPNSYKNFVLGKAQHDPKVMPLQPIEVPGEPFERLVLDCVGPLPRSSKGNEYLLIIMCSATRFPEAIPLRTSQGVVERFHRTFKTMLRTYCCENEKEWDVYIPMLLFAVRDSVHSSLGYSPFQLVYVHQVRSPMEVIKNQLISDEKDSITLQEMKEKIKKIWKVAHENLEMVQEGMKRNYDKKAAKRELDIGDKVLVYLPTSGKVFNQKYIGPCTVKEKVSDVNYRIQFPTGRRKVKIFHINKLKRYNESSGVLSIAKADDEKDVEGKFEVRIKNTEYLRDYEKFRKLCIHLSDEQQQDFKVLIKNFSDLFSDHPKRIKGIQHKIRLREETPISQRPYRMSPRQQQRLKTEVAYLLKHGLAEESHSEWASPCILVDKPDGSARMCTDYRKVNNVTIKDSYPMPRVEDIIDNVAKFPFLSKIDLLKGYYQIELDKNSRNIAAFVTPHGLYNYKCEFGKTTVQYLKHEIGSGQVRPVDCHIEVIKNLTIPTSKRGVMKFLGRVGYYRKFCNNFSDVAYPLTELLKKGVRASPDAVIPQPQEDIPQVQIHVDAEVAVAMQDIQLDDRMSDVDEFLEEDLPEEVQDEVQAPDVVEVEVDEVWATPVQIPEPIPSTSAGLPVELG